MRLSKSVTYILESFLMFTTVKTMGNIAIKMTEITMTADEGLNCLFEPFFSGINFLTLNLPHLPLDKILPVLL